MREIAMTATFGVFACKMRSFRPQDKLARLAVGNVVLISWGRWFTPSEPGRRRVSLPIACACLALSTRTWGDTV